MKRFFKWFGISVGVVVVLAGAVLAHAIWFKPFSIRVFYERVFLEYALQSPQALSYIGILKPLGLEFYQNDLDDHSIAHTREMNAELRADLETLRSYERADLEPGQQLSYDILTWFLDIQAQGQRWAFHNYPVNQLFGVQSSLPDFMVQIHRVEDEGDAEDYIARLAQFDRVFDQVIAQLIYREERDIVPPRFVVEKVLAEMRSFIDKQPNEHLLYVKFVEKLDEAGIDGETRDDLLANAARVIETSVYPGYEKLIAYFTELQSKAKGNYGVWALPNGEAYYDYLVRLHTTTDLTAAEVHQIGLDEVAHIETQMDAILDSQGYTEGSVGERMIALTKEPRFLFPDTDAGREQILAGYRDIIDEINAGLDPYFDVRPEASVEVRRIPEFKEETAPGAYYQGPSMDGSRPGVFYANLREVSAIPKWGMRTLAYHEGVPGHHFQVAIQQEIEGVPTFRTLLGFTAYQEGWGLYAERLAWELGYLENPFDNLGRLQSEMFRAVRLVVDTGIHFKRWSRERAIDYMVSKTGMPRGEVVAEIERYFVMPGQALAYKIGMLKILELRERAKKALGEDFEIREFHNVILTSGAMPLTILEDVVNNWIAAERETNSSSTTDI